MPTSPSMFPSTFWASVSKDGGCIFSSHLQGLFRSIFYMVISAFFFLDNWKTCLFPHHAGSVERLSWSGRLQSPPSHRRLPRTTMLASPASASTHRIPGGLCWALHCTCLGLWWRYTPVSLTFATPLPAHIFCETVKTIAFS